MAVRALVWRSSAARSSVSRVVAGLLLAGALASCGADDGKPGDDEPHAPAAPPERIGRVMVEVGHRFETAGRAAQAQRWPLAEYEVHEILEIFEADMTVVLLPGDCDDEGADAAYEALHTSLLPELRAAAADADADAFGQRFATASASCNQCHAACQVPFVQVPARPGLEVPNLAGPTIPTTAPTAAEVPGLEPGAEGARPTEVLDPWGD